MTDTLQLNCCSTLVDQFGRVHTSLRISVTDRCNIRCFYCMPAEGVVFRPRDEILSFEEIEQFVAAVSQAGVSKLRITGGEPLVRQDVWRLVERLIAMDNIEEVALTTNGILLSEQAEQLKQSGLHRLNISLDTLSEKTFQQITRRTGLSRVLAGIQAAQDAGFTRIRINALAIRDLTEDDIVPLGQFARRHDLHLRFIEFMPLDADGEWKSEQVLSGNDVRQCLEAALGPLVPSPRNDPSQPAVDYEFSDGAGQVGFINPVTQPFCGDCNRLRLTAEGHVRNCLFSTADWDVRPLLRRG
ncbi:MAG: GTP 3',8-cyclase MoaA, partial [Planctomycetales bacterium]